MNRLLEIPRPATLADLLVNLGHIPPQRIRLDPPPGQATEHDLLALHDAENLLCELVDGVLVEKPKGLFEARVASVLGYYLEDFAWKADLGVILGADAMFRILKHQVRIPDVVFVSWKKLPGRKLPADPIPDLFPDLAAEVLSASNTMQEMERKLQEYFEAGVKLVWFIDPEAKTVEVSTSPTRKKLLTIKDDLTGGRVLPGFSLSLKTFFARVGEKAE